MKCVFDDAQNAHAPARYLRYGNIVDFPESPERVERLLAGAAKAGLERVTPQAFDHAPLGAVHTERYLEFLEHGHAQWRTVSGSFPEMMPSIRPVEAPSEYPENILGRAGWHIQDFSSAITADTWKSVHASAMTALTAVDLVNNGERAAYALCRPPGHHAYAERAGGFCYLNNSAIAAETLRKTHGKVAVLDVDVHHGNGTQSIFYERPDVLTISIHGDPRNYYPFFYGYADQRGDGALASNISTRLAPGGSITGRVVDTEGAGVADCRIRAHVPGDALVTRWSETDEGGRFDVGGLTTGSYRLLIVGGTCGSGATDLHYRAGGRSRLTADASRAGELDVDLGEPSALAKPLVLTP